MLVLLTEIDDDLSSQASGKRVILGTLTPALTD